MHPEGPQELKRWHHQNKEEKLFGRYITFPMIEPLLKSLPGIFKLQHLGNSFQKNPIFSVTIGSGPIKVLCWSQMHGNESTGTKAVFDLFKFFTSPGEAAALADKIIKQCTIVFIPILNPDGAASYTRKNAQDIDLNRDAIQLQAPESKVLHEVLKTLKPKFCFNLHDQRTIFSVGKDKHPATLSFLAPSEDEARSLTPGRKITMAVISEIVASLQKLIPNNMGRYTDEFYPTATGDNFQKAGHNTVLIEAGHSQDDYQREEVRIYNFIALVSGLFAISTNANMDNHKSYFEIPNNDKYYMDIIYKNIFISESDTKVDVGLVFKEVLVNGALVFKEEISKVGDLSGYNANKVIDKNGAIFKNEEDLLQLIKK